MQSLAIYGGTFDPIHRAHISTAVAIQSTFHFDRFCFVPCKETLIKPASSASVNQRLAMLKIALDPYPEFRIDDREIQRETPSYMIETLTSFRQEYPDVALTLIIGMDSFLTLPRWHRWEEILTVSNILVMQRPGCNQSSMSESLKNILEKHSTYDNFEILRTPFGKIIQFNAGNVLLSSTEIRNKIKNGLSVQDDLTFSVNAYIKKEKLYLTLP